MTTKAWILLFGALALACAVLGIFLLWPGEADFAQVYSDGVLLYTLDLRVDQTRTVDSSFGTNVITVSGGKIAVTEATCPDHYCMKRGFCSGGAQIVCLPNRLVIRFGGTPEIDAAVG
jgi:hypothetical protein